MQQGSKGSCEHTVSDCATHSHDAVPCSDSLSKIKLLLLKRPVIKFTRSCMSAGELQTGGRMLKPKATVTIGVGFISISLHPNLLVKSLWNQKAARYVIKM